MPEERRKNDKDMSDIIHSLSVALSDHIKNEDFRLDTIEGTVRGMKEKVDEMHLLLVQAKAVGGFFGGIKAIAGWLLVIGALIALFKGWIGVLISWAMIRQ